MAPQIDFHLSEGVVQGFQQTQDFVHQRIHSLTTSAQQVSESLKQTATQATDRVIDRATTTIEQGWQTAEHVKHTTSAAVQTAIASSVNDWLTQHPIFLRLFQILAWATNHPIISFIILLFIIALIWSIIKAIIHLIETTSWSILQFPLKLFPALITATFLYLTKLVRFAVAKMTVEKKTDNVTTIIPEISPTIYESKQQRLAEISQRLKVIQQEQNQLLQEAADLIGSDAIDIKVEQITFNHSRN